MKSLIALMFVCFSVALFGQAPNYVRSPLTTNYPSVSPRFESSLSLSNFGAVTFLNLLNGSSDQSVQLNSIFFGGASWELFMSTNFFGILGNYGTVLNANSTLGSLTLGSSKYVNLLDPLGNRVVTNSTGFVPAAADITSLTNFVGNSTNLITTLMATNNGASSNVTVNFAGQRRIEIFLTNNITITNFAGLLAGTFSDVAIHLIPQLIPRGIGVPTLGAPSFGTYVHTNQNSPIWPTATNELVLSISTRGTNQYWSMSEWR